LYAAWLAQLNRSLSDHHLAELDARVSEWRNQVVKSLRELRRQLRSYPSSASIYSELKCLELRAEQQQQDLMYAFYQSAAELPYGGDSLLANLTRVARL